MRLKLFEKYFPLKMFMDAGQTPVLAATNIQYKRPVRLFDQPHGVMWLSKMGHASVTFQAELYVDGQITTLAEHVGVFIESDTGKPIRLPQICVDKFKSATELVPRLTR